MKGDYTKAEVLSYWLCLIAACITVGVLIVWTLDKTLPPLPDNPDTQAVCK